MSFSNTNVHLACLASSSSSAARRLERRVAWRRDRLHDSLRAVKPVDILLPKLLTFSLKKTQTYKSTTSLLLVMAYLLCIT